MTQGREAAGESLADLTRPAALVFDMDGLLLESERIVLDGFLHACRAHGVPSHPGAYHRCIGTTLERTRELLIEAYGTDFPYDAVVASWNAYCDEHLVRKGPSLKPGALEVLERVRRHAIPCALATSLQRATRRLRTGSRWWVSTSTFPSESPAIKSRGASPIPNPTEPPPLCWASTRAAPGRWRTPPTVCAPPSRQVSGSSRFPTSWFPTRPPLRSATPCSTRSSTSTSCCGSVSPETK